MSDILRSTGGETRVSALCKLLEPGVRKIATAATKLIRSEVRNEAATRRDRLIGLGASEEIVRFLGRHRVATIPSGGQPLLPCAKTSAAQTREEDR